MSSDPSLEIIPTKAMLLRHKQAQNEFKAVVFETYKSKKSGGSSKLAANKRKGDGKEQNDEIDMKRVRNEVFNFGISGYDFKDREKAKVALAVKLGAKPPKNEYKNYKQLQSEKKEEKAKREEEAYIRTVGKNSKGMAAVSCNKLVNRFTKKKKSTNTVGGIMQHYGKVNPRIHRKKKK